MTDIETLFVNRIISGLQRKSVTTCSKWATKYRKLGQPFPGPFTFDHHPWEREMHDSEAELNIGQKAAQMGFTDTVLNIAFYTIDIKGSDVLYVLPATTPDARDFSASRFNPALEASEHLNLLFSDVQNIGHKRAGTRNLFIRGSRSRSGLKSIPVGLLILDELDEMSQDNIPLAMERLSGQLHKSTWMISTPTVEDMGINLRFKKSSQNHFYFKCPHCSRFIELSFPQSLVITADDPDDPKINNSHLICNLCAHPIDNQLKPNYLRDGFWVESYTDREDKGWYINQLYSPTASPISIAKLYLSSFHNKSDEQEFYNSKLGLTHEVEGSRITETIILKCIGNYLKGPSSSTNRLVTMGVDQGTYLHYEIDEWIFNNNDTSFDLTTSSRCRVLQESKCRNFEDLDQLMREYQIQFCVIDAQPERRKATEFANRFYGHVRLCWYPEGINTKQIMISDTGGEPSVSVDRTTWLDASLGRFYNQQITLPSDTSFEYKEHLKAISRIYLKDRNGNPIGRYVSGNKPDHFAHARNYSEVALHLATGTQHNTNITHSLI